MPKQLDPARNVRIASGLTLCASCRAVADEFTRGGAKRLSPGQIEHIYRRNRPRTVS
jgi:hypothetical protein